MTGLTPSVGLTAPTARWRSWLAQLAASDAYRRSIVLATLVVIGAISAAFRWHAATMLDPFEDGYQHWWIASNLVETGTFWDRHSGMTQGSWLPLYDFFAASILLVAGPHNIGALKAAGIAFSLGTMGIVYLLGRRISAAIGLLAFALLAFNPIDIPVSGYSIADPLAVFATFAAILALTSTWSRRTTEVVAAVGLVVAVATRYEAWIVVLLLIAYAGLVGFPRVTFRRLLLIVLPAVVFFVFWLVWTSQFGFLPSIVVDQTSTDVRYKVEGGLQPGITTVLQRYWQVVLFYVFPVVLVGGAYAILRIRRDLLAWIVVTFWGLVSAYIVLRLGQPSPRYVLITFPALSILAAQAIAAIFARARSRPGGSIAKRPILRGSIALGLAAALVVPLAVQSVNAILTPPRPIGLLMQPMERAGLWVSGVPVDRTRILISESPIAAYYSQWPASSILGSRWLPQERHASLSFLHDRVAYVVYVGVPYYSLRTLLPELQAGSTVTLDNVRFELVYDANGIEAEFGAHLVYVFRVVAL